jgi:hypothetical protein
LQAELDVLPETEVVPDGQLAHTNASVRVLEVAPARAYLPAGHTTAPVHLFVPSPTLEPKVPAGQLLQVAFPGRENVPVGQGPVHWSFTPLPYRPAAQGRQEVEPLDEYVPAGQVAHTDGSVTIKLIAPGREYIPAGHETGPEHDNDVNPETDPNVLAGHLAHASDGNAETAPERAYVPRGQVTVPEQTVEVAPVIEPYLPAAHGVQASEPDEDLYVPAGQEAHTVARDAEEDVAPGRAYLPAGQVTDPEQELDVSPTSEPYRPAGHLAQTVSSVTVLDLAPSRANEPIGQETTPEQASDVSLARDPNLPAGQGEHVVEPDVEYVPAGQLAQTVSSVIELDLAPGNAFVPAGHVTDPAHVEEVCPELSPK